MSSTKHSATWNGGLTVWRSSLLSTHLSHTEILEDIIFSQSPLIAPTLSTILLLTSCYVKHTYFIIADQNF